MLVLSRKLHESVVLSLPDGTECVITVVHLDRGKVRLGFAAPMSVNVIRSELLPQGQGESDAEPGQVQVDEAERRGPQGVPAP